MATNSGPWTEEKANQVAAELMQKTTTDAAFRKLALEDPHAAIAQLSDNPIPAGVSIRFVENEGATFTFVLPDPVNEELSDMELENVAGGARCGGSCAASCAVSGILS